MVWQRLLCSDASLSRCGGRILASAARQIDVEDIAGGVTGESGRPGDNMYVKELMRCTSEVFFARVTTTTILRDSVPFEYF